MRAPVAAAHGLIMGALVNSQAHPPRAPRVADWDGCVEDALAAAHHVAQVGHAAIDAQALLGGDGGPVQQLRDDLRNGRRGRDVCQWCGRLTSAGAAWR